MIRPETRCRPGRGAVVVVVLGLLVVAGGGCSSPPPDRAEVVRAFRTSGIPASQARCAVDAIYDHLSDEQVRQLVDRGAGGTPKDDPTRTDDALDRLNAAMAACRNLGTGATSTTTTTPGASIGTAADTGDASTSAPAVGSTDPASSSSTTVPAATSR